MSTFIDYLRLGLRGILTHKLRSALTAIGVVLGIAALLSMMAVGEGGRRDLMDKMESLGLNNIVVHSRMSESNAKKSGSSMLSYGVTFSDLRTLIAFTPGLIRAAPVREIHHPVYFRGQKLKAKVEAVTPAYFETLSAKLKRGRFIAPLDEERKGAVCVLASPLPELLQLGIDPLEATIDLGGQQFRVVGELQALSQPDERAGEVTKAERDARVVRILIPLQTAVSRFGFVTTKEEQGKFEVYRLELDQIKLECSQPLVAAPVVHNILKKSHQDRDYEVNVPLELLRHRQETQRTFNLVMLLVAGLTLVVGGVGIVNIMLVSVTERTKEIGIRRALGARRKDIIQQFLVETVALTGSGGVLGVVLGLAGIRLIAWYTGWPVAVTLTAIMGTLLLAMFAGVIFGLYPAYRAAATHPAVTLRYA